MSAGPPSAYFHPHEASRDRSGRQGPSPSYWIPPQNQTIDRPSASELDSIYATPRPSSYVDVAGTESQIRPHRQRGLYAVAAPTLTTPVSFSGPVGRTDLPPARLFPLSHLHAAAVRHPFDRRSRTRSSHAMYHVDRSDTREEDMQLLRHRAGTPSSNGVDPNALDVALPARMSWEKTVEAPCAAGPQAPDLLPGETSPVRPPGTNAPVYLGRPTSHHAVEDTTADADMSLVFPCSAAVITEDLDMDEMDHVYTFPCEWMDERGTCNMEVVGDRTWMNHHLGRVHNVVGQEKMQRACLWRGCTETMNKGNLARHVVSRHLRAGASCGYCSKVYSRADVARRHIKKCKVANGQRQTKG